MKQLNELTIDKLIELGINHSDDTSEVFECLEQDYMKLLRKDLYDVIEKAGYDMNS